MFLGQVPIMIVASVLAWYLIPATIPPAYAREPAEDDDNGMPFSRLDIAGSITLASAILFLMLPLELGGQKLPWSHPMIFVLGGLAVVTGVFFVQAEKRAKEPVFPLGLFKVKDFVISFTVFGLQMGAQSSMMFTVPLYFQVTEAASSTRAGAHLLPAVMGNTISQLISGAFIGRTGRYKFLAPVGTSLTSVCYCLLLLRWDGHTNLWESLYIIPGGFGTGLAGSALFIALTASIDPSMVAIGSSSMYLSTSVGSLFGMASSSAVLQSVVRHGLQRVVAPDVADRDEFIRRCLEDIGFIQRLQEPMKNKVVQIYLRGFDGIYSKPQALYPRP
ncbi:Major facilitator superfamily [Macrophomina phaseolina MS6]|uniref:Major facilitator superfamily n=1 Tax=Macrophomina phaseolina (strain MS6) TaxID=1126212 RepID=K2QWX2_MACPH|nr:Major facilitator superfamily [Macrophomina phaseolina MS6]